MLSISVANSAVKANQKINLSTLEYEVPVSRFCNRRCQSLILVVDFSRLFLGFNTILSQPINKSVQRLNDQHLPWKVCLTNPIDFNLLLNIAAAFDTWAAQAQLPNTQALKDIGHPTEPPFIGVDARHFLEQLYLPYEEEDYLAALGGFPLAFETQIIEVINEIESLGCRLHFVFNGLQTNFDEPQFDNSVSETIARAFKVYKQNLEVEQARDLFTSSGIVIIRSYIGILTRNRLSRYQLDLYCIQDNPRKT